MFVVLAVAVVSVVLPWGVSFLAAALQSVVLALAVSVLGLVCIVLAVALGRQFFGDVCGSTVWCAILKLVLAVAVHFFFCAGTFLVLAAQWCILCWLRQCRLFCYFRVVFFIYGSGVCFEVALAAAGHSVSLLCC